MTEFRVLVCGGRDYGRKWNGKEWFKDEEHIDRLYKVLDAALASARMASKTFVLIHGDARGADRLSHEWAQDRQIRDIRVYEADWETHGKSAGPVRNKKMLTEGNPHVIIAFEGGRGTADMIRQGKKAGVPVYEVK